MHPEAVMLRQALLGVAENGTAQRIRSAFLLSDGTYLAVGKTGTGDNRHNIYSLGGHLISSKAINRTAVFVFFIGDRFYGVVTTAYVAGQDSDDYNFTSGLAVQVLKAAAPQLMPLLTPGG